jgi:hypothetical protein
MDGLVTADCGLDIPNGHDDMVDTFVFGRL